MGIDADAEDADYGVFIDVMSLYQPDLDDTGGGLPARVPRPSPSRRRSTAAIHNVGLFTATGTPRC